MLLETKGVKRGSGKGNPKAQKSKADTVSALAKECGVDERTARRRMAMADAYDALPKKDQKAVDAGTSTLAKAEALRAYAQQAGESIDAQNDFGEIKIEITMDSQTSWLRLDSIPLTPHVEDLRRELAFRRREVEDMQRKLDQK